MTKTIQVADIESRISALVQELLSTKFNNTSAYNNIMGMVAQQSILSSTGGKRLRALLTIESFLAATAAHTHDKAVTNNPSNYSHSLSHNANSDTANTLTTSQLDSNSLILDVACALEVFQTAALIHDDIIDDADLRRGKPSAHKALTTQTHNESIGVGLGLMIGDILATGSIAIVQNASNAYSQNHKMLNELVTPFIAMQREVSIGQVLDLGIEMMSFENLQELREASFEVFRWKTASYTTIAPIELGFLTAGIPAQDARKLALAIGEPLGIAFQLVDDLLDIGAGSHPTGKPIGGDIREGKRSVLLADTLEHLSQDDSEKIIRLYQQTQRTDDDVAFCLEKIHEANAIEISKQRVNELWQTTCTAISQSPIPASSQHKLREICKKFITL
ncbi:MAG: polyprenyl synthetase family protein [Bifidobacteriaceae bacterium]|nr:polyprenyl synthetase family protein [Bifidobacteriaceae bacterium]